MSFFMPPHFLCILAIFLAIPTALADLYVINPRKGSSWSAGQEITVTWLDDGVAPPLSAIGEASVGLYHGQEKLVQTIQSVNVGQSHSITFRPIAAAGPNDDKYYISFISTELKDNNTAHAAFSPFFSLTGMKGSFDTPLASATSSKSSPSTTSSSPSQLSTITVGTLSTNLPPIASISASVTPSSSPSRFSTVAAPSASVSSASSAPPSSNSSIRTHSTGHSLFTTLAMVGSGFLAAFTCF
ncbi:hypothetical protein DL96DRAFT_1597091 [Flagelloscypha sp. PMI_526]|nr:hypothetical protein DL96DRAFT_1597091 [Flagelloscypha sp. PMI_526]